MVSHRGRKASSTHTGQGLEVSISLILDGTQTTETNFKAELQSHENHLKNIRSELYGQAGEGVPRVEELTAKPGNWSVSSGICLLLGAHTTNKCLQKES